MTTTGPHIIVWDETVTVRFRPRYFTGEAWASLSAQQRDMIRRQRMSVVEQLRAEHETRYHHGDRRMDSLAYELDDAYTHHSHYGE